MVMFDDTFMDIIAHTDIVRFDQWIKQWGVENVVAKSQKSQIGEKKHWITVLLHYFPTLHAWTVSDLCAPKDAEYVLEHMYEAVINNDRNGALAKKCDRVFAQQMFHSHRSVLQSMIGMMKNHHNGLIEHIFAHPDFQKHLWSTQSKSQTDLQSLFSTMIIASRTMRHSVGLSVWERFRETTPAYHIAWLIPYTNALLNYNFTNVVEELMARPDFKQWEGGDAFVDTWVRKHTLQISHFSETTYAVKYAPPAFLDAKHLSTYYGKVVWNSIEGGAYNSISVYDALEQMSTTVPRCDILLECFNAAERSVKGMKKETKCEKLQPHACHLSYILNRLNDDEMRAVVVQRPKSYEWMGLHNHPRALSMVLNAHMETARPTTRRSKL